MWPMIRRSGWVAALLVALVSAASAAPQREFYQEIDGKWVEYVPPVLLGTPYVESYRAPGVLAAPTFNVTYLDVTNSTGFGFDDAVQGAGRRATLGAIFTYLSALFVANGSVDVQVNLSTNLPLSGTLASAGSLFTAAANSCNNGDVFKHLSSGVDPNGANPDGTVKVNFGRSWNSGLGEPTATQFDLYSVLVHEMTHALGFIDLEDAAGNSVINTANPGPRSSFDRLLQNGNGLALIDCATGTYNGTAADLIGSNNGVKFTGPKATEQWQALGNLGSPPLNAPNPYNSGSSTSHWGSGVPATALMLPSIAAGAKRRGYIPLEMGALKDLGYTVRAPQVPSLGGRGMVLLAVLLLALGVGLTRRRPGDSPVEA
jgi:hypothetical protein